MQISRVRSAALAITSAAFILGGSLANALTLHPTATCALTDVSGSTACIGMVTDNGVGSPAANDTTAAFNVNSFFGYSTWAQIDRANQPATTGTNGILTVGYNAGNKSGTYSFTGGAYSVYAVVLKASAGFSAYLVNATTSGTWTTANLLNGGGKVPAISHITIYGVPSVTTVPVPAGLPLLAGGLMLLGVVARRRKA